MKCIIPTSNSRYCWKTHPMRGRRFLLYSLLMPSLCSWQFPTLCLEDSSQYVCEMQVSLRRQACAHWTKLGTFIACSILPWNTWFKRIITAPLDKRVFCPLVCDTSCTIPHRKTNVPLSFFMTHENKQKRKRKEKVSIDWAQNKKMPKSLKFFVLKPVNE